MVSKQRVPLHDARKAARLDEAGDLILPGDQDRSRCYRGQIADGTALLQPALRSAAIATCRAGIECDPG